MSGCHSAIGIARRLRLVAFAILVAAVACDASAVALAHGGARTAQAAIAPGRSCESLTALALPHSTVDSATTVAATATVPEYCDVQLTVNNPPSNDAINIGVFMPTSTWNGRFEGVGGGVYSTGNPSAPSSTALQAGYATAATDGGHPNTPGNVLEGQFALNPDRTLNWQLIDDFSYLGIHEMTQTAKSVISAYYGAGPRYSYFNGCSTGGRQGLMEAQRYPTDYNGIAAGSPAINWTKFIPSELWGELVMNWSGDFIPQCKFAAADQAAIAACDGLDSVKDGIISDWQDCRFDARTLVGTATPAARLPRPTLTSSTRSGRARAIRTATSCGMACYLAPASAVLITPSLRTGRPAPSASPSRSVGSRTGWPRTRTSTGRRSPTTSSSSTSSSQCPNSATRLPPTIRT